MNTVTRDMVEKAIWELTGYAGDQIAVDALLAVVDAYKLSETADADTAHLLMTMVGQLLDSGSRLRLVSAERAPLTRADIPEIAHMLADQGGSEQFAVSERDGKTVDVPHRARLDRALEALKNISGQSELDEALLAHAEKQRQLAGEPLEQICQGCGVWKPVKGNFKPDRKMIGGYRHTCYDCVRARSQAA